ncbi:hypothetical protein MD484_g6946, partial [Candolleomyces efflorescens]
MAYPAPAYYQQPGQPWGATQYQFGPPPPPSFQPQSTWGGLDFYRAHAPTGHDPSLFNHAWDRVRHFDMANTGGLGVGIHEARHWHRRAYGGMNELSLMNPAEIGHAAAYEAYRTWMHNQSMYEPLGPDIERQREGLIGLAVAEASRLLSFAGRTMDPYARSAASDSAAHTASYIFYQRRQDDEFYHHRRGRSASRSHYDDYDYPDDDPYRYDDEMDPYLSHRARSRSRARSMSRARSYSGSMGYEGTPYPPSHGLPPPLAGSYAGSAVGGMTPGMTPGYPPPSPYYPGGPPSAYGANPYGSSITYPGGSSVPLGLAHASSTSSGYSGYGQQPYMPGGIPIGTAMSAGSMGGVVQAPPQAIVIHKSRRHKHHRSRSRASD